MTRPDSEPSQSDDPGPLDTIDLGSGAAFPDAILFWVMALALGVALGLLVTAMWP